MTRAVSALACVAAIVLAARLPVDAADTVKLGDQPAISNVSIYIAMEKGYFRQHGITLETERLASASKMTVRLATGQIDVSVGSLSAGLFNSISTSSCRPRRSRRPIRST